VCFSHHTRTTTWEDPRKTLAAQQAQQLQASQEQLLSHAGGATSPHPAASPQPQGTRFHQLFKSISGVDRIKREMRFMQNNYLDLPTEEKNAFSISLFIYI
jgi:hypothetical protein